MSDSCSLISLIKLALAQFSVEIAVLSNVLIGAVLTAKAALVLNETPLSRSLEHYRRIVAVAVKMLFYVKPVAARGGKPCGLKTGLEIRA